MKNLFIKWYFFRSLKLGIGIFEQLREMFRRRNWNVKIKMEERFSEIEFIFQDFLMHDLFDVYVTQN